MDCGLLSIKFEGSYVKVAWRKGTKGYRPPDLI
jgi:hypothetical protein